MSRIALRPGEPIRLDGQVWFFQRRFGGSTLSLTSEVSGEIRNYTDAQLADAWAEGRLQFIKDYRDARIGISLRRDFRDVPPAERNEALRRERYAKRALTKWPCDDAALELAIQDIAHELDDRTPPRPRTLREWVRRYAAGEYDVRALLPLDRMKGNRRQRFPAEVIELAEACIEKFCIVARPGTVKDAHDELEHLINELNSQRTERNRAPIPSLSYMHRTAKKVHEERRVREQQGAWIADRKFRPVGQGLRETRPLECVEIDFTSWDGIIIDEVSMLPVGRPTLAVGYDRCTNMPWGIHFGFEMESYLTVMLLLRNGILPKTYVKNLCYADLPPIHGDWPLWGVPECIASDNTLAMRGTSLEHACQSLKIDLRHLPKKRPDLKAKVERHFGVTRVGLADWLPGKTYNAKNTDYKPSDSAILTLQHLRFLIHKYLIDVYGMQFDNRLGERRIDCWMRLTEQYQPRLPDRVHELDCLLAATTRPRTVTQTGIEVFGLKYKGLTDLHQRYGDFRVAVRYDPGKISRVWAQVPGNDGIPEYRPLQAVATEYVKDLTLWQHQKIREHMGVKAKGARTSDYLKAKHELRQTVMELVAQRQSGAGTAYRFLTTPQDPAQHSILTLPAPGTNLPGPRPRASPAPVQSNPIDEDDDTDMGKFVEQRGWNVSNSRPKP